MKQFLKLARWLCLGLIISVAGVICFLYGNVFYSFIIMAIGVNILLISTVCHFALRSRPEGNDVDKSDMDDVLEKKPMHVEAHSDVLLSEQSVVGVHEVGSGPGSYCNQNRPVQFGVPWINRELERTYSDGEEGHRTAGPSQVNVEVEYYPWKTPTMYVGLRHMS